MDSKININQLHPTINVESQAQVSPIFDNSQGGAFFAEPSQAPSINANPYPAPSARRSTRKQTLIALLDELVAFRDDDLREDGGPAPGDASQVQAGSGERITKNQQQISVDERLANEGAQMFWHFNKRIGQVDTELQNFANAVRPLGSSVGLISSAYHLRVRLQQVLQLFRENAANTFKDKVESDPPEPIRPFSSRKKSKARRQRPTRALRPSAPVEGDLETLPAQLELLARDLKSFLHFLHDIPEFTDEGLNGVVLSFEADLKYWASCLKEFQGQFKFHAVGRYVNDLTKEMDEHLEEIRDALRMFRDVGVSTIRTSQSHTATGLQNLSTVATFFSGVTATTIQYSFDKIEGSLANVVNALWISSLVFSLASAINSQLAYHWRAAMYRSPRNAVPWWVSIWLTRTPLIFLVVSVMAFSAGLVCFTFSQQVWITQILTTIFTSFTSFAMLAVALWFAGERWTFSKTKGSKWLADVMYEMAQKFYEATGITWFGRVPPKYIGKAANWGGAAMARVGTQMSSMFVNVAPMRGRTASVSTATSGTRSTRGDTSEEYHHAHGDSKSVLPTHIPPAHHKRSLSFNDEAKFGQSSVPSTPLPPLPSTPSYMGMSRYPPGTIVEDRPMSSSPTKELLQGEAMDSVEVPSSPSKSRIALQRAVKKVVLMQRRTTSESTESPLSPRGRQHSVNCASDRKLTRGDSMEQYSTRPPRFTILQPALKKLTTTQYLVEHSGLVRSLQFSPDGKYLATASWDRTAIIWKVGDPCEVYAKLLHPFGFVSQVAWSPEGKYLLTRVAKQIKVWTDSGLCIRTINRHHKVQALAWMPSGRAFICVEHSNIYVMDITGKIIDTHVLDRMVIHDAAVTPNEQRLLVVGTLEESAEGLKPSKSRAEKRIVVYDLGDKTIENQAPVLENVQDVTISQDGTLALVSYEDKAYPEVWRIDMVKGEGRLQLQSTYITPSPVDFAGPSYFGGSKEQFVICAGKAGDIYIWDRETGLLLHSLQASLPTPGDDSGDLTALGWNPYSPGRFMFSSATHDGTVRIWTAPAPPETEPPSRAGSPAPRSGGMSGSMGLAF